MANTTATRARQRPMPRRPEDGCWQLSVISGPDAGLNVLLDGTFPPRVLIGTSPACEIRLTDPLVSRRHLALDLGGPLLRVLDQDSTNGTYLQGVQVLDVLLRGGETLVIGDTTVRVQTATQGTSLPASRSIKFGKLLGASEEMRRLHPRVTTLAQSNVPIVIEGETGTGKEVLAEAIHEASTRAKGPFVVFDCSTVSAALVESELFGHEKGAFTGAITTRRGVFEEANGGTLLIDEIGELALDLQMKLLRVLERSEVKRVGGSKWIHIDVRVIAATRRDLDMEVELGRFRDDLFFRLAVGRVELPPLRRRTGDIPLLVDHFWTTLGGRPGEMPPDLIARYEAYGWPGNVRELANAVARQLALGESELGRAQSEGESPASGGQFPPLEDILEEVYGLPFVRAKARILGEFERRYVSKLVAVHGTVARAAAASGLARRYFQELRARHAK